MLSLRLRLAQWLIGRRLIDPARHPILSKNPELLDAPGVKWRSLADFTPEGSKSSSVFKKWYLVSVGYSEVVAKECGVQLSKVMIAKHSMIDGVERSVIKAARKFDE